MNYDIIGIEIGGYMKNKNGFTLIELLAVIVILALTFMFVIPKMVSLINEGNKTTTEIIESKVIDATKEYVFNQNSSSLNLIVHVGDSITVSKDDLLQSKLVDDSDIEKLEGFVGVKVELLSDDEFKYTVVYE